MKEQHFRFAGCSEQRVCAAVWYLFEFPEVQNLAHLYADIVGVFYNGEGHPQEWLALLEQYGYRLERAPTGRGMRGSLNMRTRHTMKHGNDPRRSEGRRSLRLLKPDDTVGLRAEHAEPDCTHWLWPVDRLMEEVDVPHWNETQRSRAGLFHVGPRRTGRVG